MKIYYFNSTHWDREWYYPKEAFRKQLVKMAGILLDIFDKQPEFRKFTFDGQTIVLEDILEIRPEWRPRLEKRISKGRLNVGPWYVMPDEFLVSGEALIRNLLVGRRIAASFGAPAWPVGYVCDIFGHTSQMPQIMKGFGLMGAVGWRGIRQDASPFLMWRSPDGTEIPLLHLMPRNGYGQFSMEVRGLKDTPMDEQTFKKRFMEWLPEVKAYWGDRVFLMDALDHAEPNHETLRMLAWIQECCPEAEIIHTDFREVFTEDFPGHETVTGELIAPDEPINRGCYQISSTLSSRYDIKQANDRCQSLLELQIEPMLASRNASAAEERPFLEYAWKHLLQNHAHDSICGCSPDMTHRQMFPRFEEVEVIAQQMMQEHRFQDYEHVTGKPRWTVLHSDFYDDAAKAEAECDAEGRYLVRIYNPLPYEVEQVSELELAFPNKIPYPRRFVEPFSSESINAFLLRDAEGHSLDYKISRIQRMQQRILTTGTAHSYDIYTVVTRTRLKPSGWTELQITPEERPVRNFQSLLTGRRSASNGIIEMEISADGTFSVHDLRTGKIFPGQNDYRFHREIGNGWGHVAPVGGDVTTGGYCKSIRILHDGPERAEFEITRVFELPEELVFKGGIYQNFVGMENSPVIRAQEIVTRVALDRGSDQLSIHTEIDNHLRDIRLQLIVPTQIKGEYFSSQAFFMTTRKPGRETGRDSERFCEPESPDKNFDGIVGKRDASGGMAFISRGGLHECGCLAEAEDELTVTLMRCFRRTVMHNGETDGQLNKRLSFDYALKCLLPECTAVDLHQARQILQATPFFTYLVAAKDAATHEASSFLRLEGPLAFSALKPAEGGTPGEIILRLFNPSSQEEAATLHFGKPFQKADICRMDETCPETIAQGSDTLHVTAAPWQILTLKISLWT